MDSDDKKITELTIGVPLGTDIMPYVSSPSISPVTKSTYYDNGGWIAASTWTRTGNYTFTVSGDLTALYRKGIKVRYKDGGSYEYGYVISSSYSSPDTTVTLATNSDFSMAAATITDNYYSITENPEGFPQWLNWTPTFTGFSADPTGLLHRFKLIKNQCFLEIRHATAGTSNASTFTITLPVPAITITNMAWFCPCRALDNSAGLSTPSLIRILSAGTIMDVYKDYGLAGWTTSGGKLIAGAEIWYEI